MRTLIVLTGLLFAVAFTNAQESPLKQQVSYATSDSVTLSQTLEQLSEKYQLEFAYDADLLNKLYVSRSFTQKPLAQVLEAWLHPHGLNYELSGEVILVFPDPKVKVKSKPRKSQNIAISGSVSDARTGESLPYAHISILNSSRGTVTNADGRFTLLRVSPQAKALEVSHLGYAKDTVPVKTGVYNQNVAVALTPQSKTLAEVTVQDTEESMLRTNRQPGMHTVDPFRLQTVATTGQGSIMQALQLLPGINATAEASSGLHVRGGKADQNLILFDGFTIYHIDHVYGIFDAINADAVKHIRLYKGGFPARYGNRTSSVIDITGRDGNRKSFSGLVGADLMSVRTRLEGPLNQHTSALLTARHSFTQFLHEGLYQGMLNSFFTSGSRNRRVAEEIAQQTSLQPQVRFYDMNVRVAYRSPEAGDVTLSFFRGQDFLNVDAQNQQHNRSYNLNEESSWGNSGTALNWTYPWNGRHETSLDFSYSAYTGSSSFKEQFTSGHGQNEQALAMEENNRLRDISLRGVHRMHWNRHIARAGLEVSSYNARYSQANNGNAADSLHQEAVTLSAFVENSFDPGASLRLIAGARILRHSTLAKWYAEPRLSAYYNATPRLTLKAAYGRYHQFLGQLRTDRFQSSEPIYWLIADGELFGEAASTHYVAGLQYRLGNWMLDVEGYYKHTRGITGTQALNNPYLERDSADRQLKLPKNGTNIAQGVDVMLQRTKGVLTGWLSYSVGTSKNRFAKLNQGDPFPADYHRLHELNIVMQYTVNQWTFGAKWIYATGTPYTKPNPEHPLQNLYDLQNLNAHRLPPYHRLDISAMRRIHWNNLSGEIGLNLINVYNRTNIRSRVYRIALANDGDTPPGPGQNQRYTQPYDLELMHFMPNVFLRVKF